MLLYRCRHLLPVLLVTYLLVGATAVFAQKAAELAPAIKFGKITPDQFTNPSPDSTAEAVVLYNYCQVDFDVSANELWLTYTYHVRTQIRKKSAYDRATIELVARRGKAGQHEYVYDFDGYTYNLNNGNVSIDRMASSAHFTEKASDQHWLEKYTLPNVREGSIVEYRYSFRTPFTISHNPKTWRFQQDVPVNWSEYRITVPDYFYYKILLGGYLELAISEKKQTNVSLLTSQNMVNATAYRFAVKNAPAFRDEVYITTEDDYLSKVEFELARYQLPNQLAENFSVDWTDMDRTLLDDPAFGGQIKRAAFLRETAKSLPGQPADTLTRVKAAYDFVRQRIKWNGEASFWSRSIRKVFDDKKGDAGDINLLLIALLREMDIDAHPVMLSTRSNGRIDQSHALLRKFNYVVAQVSIGGKDLLLDATDTYLTPGMLPLHCLNGTGRLVHPTRARFISLDPIYRDVEAMTGTFTINTDGEVTGTLMHSHGGYSAWSARQLFTTGGKTKYVDDVRKKRPAWQLEKADFLEGDAFTATYSLTIPEACSQAGDRFYFLPMLTEARTVNPFKELERLYPVDFGVVINENVLMTYTLPPGFQVEELPKPVSMVLPENGGRFIYQVTSMNGNQLQVTSSLLLRRSMYFAQEYPALRELFSQIVAKHAEQVVLKKGTVAEKK